MASPSRSDIDGAGFRGGARAEFIASVRRLTDSYRQGRAASACMADVMKALTAFDARSPKVQARRKRP
jgi:hypothetical protein